MLFVQIKLQSIIWGGGWHWGGREFGGRKELGLRTLLSGDGDGVGEVVVKLGS